MCTNVGDTYLVGKRPSLSVDEPYKTHVVHPRSGPTVPFLRTGPVRSTGVLSKLESQELSPESNVGTPSVHLVLLGHRQQEDVLGYVLRIHSPSFNLCPYDDSSYILSVRDKITTSIRWLLYVSPIIERVQGTDQLSPKFKFGSFRRGVGYKMGKEHRGGYVSCLNLFTPTK